MLEKPSQWLKRAQERDAETPAEPPQISESEPFVQEPETRETRAEYRDQLKHMVELVIAAQKGDRPSPDRELGEKSA